MATKPTDQADIGHLKEVIRLLNLALADCEKLLQAAEQAVRESQQDNDPSQAEGRR